MHRSGVVQFLAGSGSTHFTYEREGESLTYVRSSTSKLQMYNGCSLICCFSSLHLLLLLCQYFEVIGSRVSPGGGEGSDSGNIVGPIGLAIISL